MKKTIMIKTLSVALAMILLVVVCNQTGSVLAKYTYSQLKIGTIQMTIDAGQKVNITIDGSTVSITYEPGMTWENWLNQDPPPTIDGFVVKKHAENGEIVLLQKGTKVYWLQNHNATNEVERTLLANQPIQPDGNYVVVDAPV